MIGALRRLLATSATAMFAGGLAVLALATLWLGRSYYLLPRYERGLDELDPLLSAGHGWGVTIGLLGTTLMVVMNLYTLRKKLMGWHWLGSMAGWLRFHIICGVFGPIFILLHAGLTWPTGLIAVGFWCMTLVALSGTFGRYVYGLLPRATGGGALGLQQARAELADLHGSLVLSTADASVEELGSLMLELKEMEIEATSLADVARGLGLYRQRRRRIRAALTAASLPSDVERSVRELLFRQIRLIRGLELSQVARRLLRYWHLFHRPLAGAMYVIVLVHVAGAVVFGGSLKEVGDLLAAWGGTP
ncbi:MAG: hypothetical protein KDA24_01515 [Deltaproteobacteria bacterium]|nr:hypothetical protein [Deltaproteobacteria bacterium]